MAPPTTPLGRALRAALADGEWHTLDQLVAAGLPAIPPSVAAHKSETNRLRKGTKGERKRGDAQHAGARHIVRGSLASMVDRGRVEKQDNRYRLTNKGVD